MIAVSRCNARTHTMRSHTAVSVYRVCALLFTSLLCA